MFRNKYSVVKLLCVCHTHAHKNKPFQAAFSPNSQQLQATTRYKQTAGGPCVVFRAHGQALLSAGTMRTRKHSSVWSSASLRKMCTSTGSGVTGPTKRRPANARVRCRDSIQYINVSKCIKVGRGRVTLPATSTTTLTNVLLARGRNLQRLCIASNECTERTANTPRNALNPKQPTHTPPPPPHPSVSRAENTDAGK
jgi:hypothetical protein